MKLICKNCSKEFDWFQTSTIKPVLCRICHNKNLLNRATFYNQFKANDTKQVCNTEKQIKYVKTPKNGIKLYSKNPDKNLDAAWSKLVKLNAGNKCEVCGNTKSLNSHHIFSRAKKSVRWDEKNGICLCVNHHIGSVFSAHKTPVDFTNWLIKKRGQIFVDELSIRANQTAKIESYLKASLLKYLTEKIKNFAE